MGEKKKYADMNKVEKLMRDIDLHKKVNEKFELSQFGKPGYNAHLKQRRKMVSDMQAELSSAVAKAEEDEASEKAKQAVGQTNKRGVLNPYE